MNKVAQFYRELVATLTERLRNGERDIDALVASARQQLAQTSELTRTEAEEVTRAVRRDLEEFARSYGESQDESEVTEFDAHGVAVSGRHSPLAFSASTTSFGI